MLSMILASTFAVPMVIISFVFLFSFLEQSEPTVQLGSLASLPTFGQKGKTWLASRRQAKASAAIENLFEEMENETTVEDFLRIMQSNALFYSQPASQTSLVAAEMPASEFEELVWACTLPDYAKLASGLLSRPKPQRGKGGRFVKRVRSQPDLTQTKGQVNAEPLAPIPAVFSFFKGLYQPTINILIHINQQFNNTYPLPAQ